MPAKKKEAGAVVAVSDVIHDGKGGYLQKGDAVPDGADLESLKAKGLI